MTKTLHDLEALVRLLGDSGGFKALGPCAERHGSWEIVSWRDSAAGDLDRFVLFAVTEVDSRYEVAFRAGAERQGHFARRLVEEFGVDATNEPELRLRVSQGFERAIAIAEGFQVAELVDTYLPSRFPAQLGASASASAD